MDNPIAIEVKKLDSKTNIAANFSLFVNSFTNKKASVTPNNVKDKTNKILLISFLKMYSWVINLLIQHFFYCIIPKI